MSVAELDERPAKKRRFFLEDSPPPKTPPSPPAAPSKTPDATTSAPATHTDQDVSGFDVQLLESIVGEKLSPDVQRTLRELSDGNVERGKPPAPSAGVGSRC